MKKLLITALVLSSTAFAATATTTVTINGTVANSCTFFNENSPASFNYTAADGSSGVINGSATLVCNNGTLGTGKTATATSPVTLTKSGGSDTLSVTVTVTSGPVSSITSGPLSGGQAQTYSVTPAAAANQWGASTGSYSGTTLLTITF